MASPPDPTPQQLRFYSATQQNRRAWVALLFMFCMFAVGFIAFLVALFKGMSPIGTSILGGIDFLLAWHMRRIYSNLFPTTGKPWWETVFGGRT